MQLAFGQLAVIVDLKYLKWDSREVKSFVAVLQHPNVEKIFHCAKPDFEVLRQVFGSVPSMPIFDTQVAAKAVGYLKPQVSLKDLVGGELNLDLLKTEQRSDWTKEPLSKEQLNYAAGDVIFLLRIKPILVEKLGERRDWVQEEFEKISDPRQYEADPSRLWEKLNFPPSTSLQSRFALQQMAIVRDFEARRINVPRGRLYPDSDLLTLAKNLPNNEGSASRVLRRRFGDPIDRQMLAACQQAYVVDRDILTQFQPEEKVEVPDSLLHLVEEIVKILSRQKGVAETLIGGRKEIFDLVAAVFHQKDFSQMPMGIGWRYEHFGSTIVDFISGKSAVKWVGNKLQLVQLST